MDWNKFFTIVAYSAGAAGSILATAGVAIPAWLTAAIPAIAAIAGKMAASHSTAINQKAIDTSNGDLG